MNEFTVELVGNGKMPTYNNPNDACLDAYACLEEGAELEVFCGRSQPDFAPDVDSEDKITYRTEVVQDGTIFLNANERVRIPLGIRVEIPVGWKLMICGRSGNNYRGRDIRMGTCDAGYTGMVSAVLVNPANSKGSLVFNGEKICQLAFEIAPKVKLVQGEIDRNTVRGESGFGSSGMK